MDFSVTTLARSVSNLEDRLAQTEQCVVDEQPAAPAAEDHSDFIPALLAAGPGNIGSQSVIAMVSFLCQLLSYAIRRCWQRAAREPSSSQRLGRQRRRDSGILA